MRGLQPEATLLLPRDGVKTGTAGEWSHIRMIELAHHLRRRGISGFFDISYLVLTGYLKTAIERRLLEEPDAFFSVLAKESPDGIWTLKHRSDNGFSYTQPRTESTPVSPSNTSSTL